MTPSERDAFIQDIAQAIRTSENTNLSDDEQRWVRLAIQREAQSIQFRKSVIEKSLGGLLWAVLVGVGYFALDFLKSHGFRP